MRKSFYYLTSSIGKKQLMAFTAICLCGFACVHLIGNALMFLGPKYFNLYGYTLTSNPFLPFAEVMLAFLFGSHIVLGTILYIENQKARPQNYYLKVRSGRGATFSSLTMAYTGIILLVFLVVHIINFRLGTIYMTTQNGVEMRDFYRLMIEFYSNPLYSAGYIACMVVLSFHLSHGIQSIFQSVGFWHPKYNPWIKRFGFLLMLILSVGFAAFPIWCYLRGGF